MPLPPCVDSTAATHWIGLMSGTSMDGMDAVLATWEHGQAQPRLQASSHQAYSPDLRQRLIALNQSGPDELHQAACISLELNELAVQAVQQVLQRSGLPAQAISAIGSHGQTVRHQPQAGYTLQLNAPAHLAERTGITVVADFRSRDVAAGGQGAPLVPAFHQALWGSPSGTAPDNQPAGHQAAHQAILNIGGFANLTLLSADGQVRGWDTGPGNVLLDAWVQRHQGLSYDPDGRWAAQGRCQNELLQALLQHPFFARHPPKSTGRDDFHLPWLDHVLATLPPPPHGHPALAAQDVQATLLALTVHSIRTALQQHGPQTQQLWVCGGGALNTTLMQGLQQALAPMPVASTASRGIDPMHVEALAFAWLARQCLLGQPGNCPAVTGACGSRILGAIYPA